MSAMLMQFLDDLGLTTFDAETLIRLALAVADGDDYPTALSSFSDPDDVDALARRAAGILYHNESNES